MNAPAPDSMPASSALGCRLRDWTVEARERPGASHATERRGLILDLDDTLYPREHYVQSGLMAVARDLEERRGIPALDAFSLMSEASRGAARGFELQALCARFCLPADVIPELLRVFRDHRPLLRLPRQSAAVLARLRGDGWRLVVLTNGLPSVQRRKVEALAIAALVDHVVYAEEHSVGGKPAASAFREAVRRLGVPAARCVCAGDDPVCDISGARALGIKTVRIRTLGTVVAREAEADAVVDSLEALPYVVMDLLDPVNIDAA